MTQYLPPNLLALFAPRDPLPFLPPTDKLPHEKKTRGYLGVGSFLSHFEVWPMVAHNIRFDRRRAKNRTTIKYLFAMYFVGSSRNATTNTSGDARGALRTSPQRESRASRLQTRTGNSYMGPNSKPGLYRRPIQDVIRGSCCKYSTFVR